MYCLLTWLWTKMRLGMINQIWTQPAITCSKLTIETLEQSVKVNVINQM